MCAWLRVYHPPPNFPLPAVPGAGAERCAPGAGDWRRWSSWPSTWPTRSATCRTSSGACWTRTARSPSTRPASTRDACSATARTTCSIPTSSTTAPTTTAAAAARTPSTPCCWPSGRRPWTTTSTSATACTRSSSAWSTRGESSDAWRQRSRPRQPPRARPAPTTLRRTARPLATGHGAPRFWKLCGWNWREPWRPAFCSSSRSWTWRESCWCGRPGWRRGAGRSSSFTGRWRSRRRRTGGGEFRCPAHRRVEERRPALVKLLMPMGPCATEVTRTGCRCTTSLPSAKDFIHLVPRKSPACQRVSEERARMLPVMQPWRVSRRFPAAWTKALSRNLPVLTAMHLRGPDPGQRREVNAPNLPFPCLDRTTAHKTDVPWNLAQGTVAAARPVN